MCDDKYGEALLHILHLFFKLIIIYHFIIIY